MSKIKISEEVARKLVKEQFPEYVDLPLQSVLHQGHDNRTYRLGDDLLIRMPTAEAYALSIAKEQKLLPRLAKHLSVRIPTPVRQGKPSNEYPYHFSIYNWLEGKSANIVNIDEPMLEDLAKGLAGFLSELHCIDTKEGPLPGQHNWWRGDHVSVYNEGALKQINQLSGIIDTSKALELWESACQTKLNKPSVWIHGDLAPGNILVCDGKLSAVIDFGGVGIGDPSCDLTMAWTFFKGKSRESFQKRLSLDNETWVRARAWTLWKATFELCQLEEKNSDLANAQKAIISSVIE